MAASMSSAAVRLILLEGLRESYVNAELVRPMAQVVLIQLALNEQYVAHIDEIFRPAREQLEQDQVLRADKPCRQPIRRMPLPSLQELPLEFEFRKKDIDVNRSLVAPDLKFDDRQAAHLVQPAAALRFRHREAQRLDELIQTRQFTAVQQDSEIDIKRGAGQSVNPHGQAAHQRVRNALRFEELHELPRYFVESLHRRSSARASPSRIARLRASFSCRIRSNRR